MIGRREVLFGGALTLLFHERAHAAGSIAPNTRGCCLKSEDVASVMSRAGKGQGYLHGEEPLVSNSGDRLFDIALGKTLEKLSAMFEVTPGFAFYDDSESPNAYATSAIRLGRADGTVAFGTTLLGECLASHHAHPEVIVAGVCAHEFGHILQFKLQLFDTVFRREQTDRRSELQADFFAGYFAGKRKLERPSFPAANIALAIDRLGDHNYDSESHHGTPEERGAAVAKGFTSAYSDGLGLSDAITLSTRYVMSL